MGTAPAAPTIGQRVRAFYERYPFPTYEQADSPAALAGKAQTGVFAALLDAQLPYDARILDAGCGTGQLPIFLSLAERRTVGIDFSFPSLAEGHRFIRRFGLKNVSLMQMDLFAPAFKEGAFDCVISTGVLHHTPDPYRAFQGLCRLVRPGGHLLIGLYNKYARIPLRLRRLIFRLTGRRLEKLDYVLRHGREETKKQIWFMDQYANPHETVHSVDEILEWFAQNGIEYLGVIPRLNGSGLLAREDTIFAPTVLGPPLARVLGQIRWMFAIGREGGLFVMVGRKIV